MLIPGAAAPSFELQDLDGGSWSLTEELKKGPVLLAFFKISCPTCQYTFPFLQRLRDGAAAGEGAVAGVGAVPQLVAVSQDNAEGTRRFMAHTGTSVRTLLDEPGQWPASNGFGISSVPSMFFVEQDGTITGAAMGFHKAALEDFGERFGVAPFQAGESIPELRPG